MSTTTGPTMQDHPAIVVRDEGQWQPIAVLEINRDITERALAERALKESEERFRLLVESVTDYAIFMLDPEGRVVSWNQGAERIKGYRTDEILGQHISLFYTPEAVARGWPAHLLKTAEIEGRVEDEGWRVRKDGTRFWADVVITALPDGSGKTLRGFGKVTRDLTERKRTEEALRELTGRLQQVQDDERRTWARVLHDTTSPNYALLISKLYQIKRLNQGVDGIIAELSSDSIALAEFLGRQVRNVSDVMPPSVLDEQGFIAALRWYLERYADRTGIHLETDLPERFIRIPRADEMALLRIVEESITSILRYSKSRMARIRLSFDRDSLRLELTDKGRAMPPDVMEQINNGTGELGVVIGGMIEQFRQFGGSMEVSTGNSGTLVAAILPVRDVSTPPSSTDLPL